MIGTHLRRAVTRLAAAVGALTLLTACSGGAPAHEHGTLRILAGSELSDLGPIFQEAEKAAGVSVKLDYAGTLDGVQQVLSGAAGARYDAIWFSSNRYLALTGRGTP